MATATFTRIFVPPARFLNRAEEARFRRDYVAQYRENRIDALLLGLVLWLGFVTTDFYYFNLYPLRTTDSVLLQVLIYRSIGVVILLTGLILIRRRTFRSEARTTVLFCVGIVLLYVINLLMLSTVPYPRHYQNGLLLVLFFIFGFFRIRSRPLGMVLLVLLVMSVPVYLDGTHISEEPSYWRSAFANLVAFCILGWGITIALERSAREAFAQRLEVEKARSAAELRARALRDGQDEVQRELTKLKQEKTEFLARAVHDLRNQAHAIGCDVAMANDGVADGRSDVVAAYLAKVEASTVRLSASFHALLDLARLETGSVRFDLKEINLVPLVQAAVDELRETAAEAKVRLGMLCRDQRPIFVRTDRYQLARVLENLVSNAIKYADTKKGSAAFVSVGLVRLSGRVRIDVVDNGLGIPEQDMLRVFEPFEQLSERRDGVGLGLSIVREIVNQLEQHQIGLSSTAGKGTRFRIDLPRIDHSGAGVEVSEPAVAKDMQRKLENAYILVIEDNREALASLASVIRARGAIVETASSQQEAMVILDELERDLDLIITDYRLDGGAIATPVVQAARDAIGEGLPIIVVTGEIEVARDDPELYGVSLVSKPILPAALVAHAASLLAGHHSG